MRSSTDDFLVSRFSWVLVWDDVGVGVVEDKDYDLDKGNVEV